MSSAVTSAVGKHAGSVADGKEELQQRVESMASGIKPEKADMLGVVKRIGASFVPAAGEVIAPHQYLYAAVQVVNVNGV